jgi:hypothetical protein
MLLYSETRASKPVLVEGGRGNRCLAFQVDQSHNQAEGPSYGTLKCRPKVGCLIKSTETPTLHPGNRRCIPNARRDPKRAHAVVREYLVTLVFKGLMV